MFNGVDGTTYPIWMKSVLYHAVRLGSATSYANGTKNFCNGESMLRSKLILHLDILLILLDHVRHTKRRKSIGGFTDRAAEKMRW